jgi:hypothetical protein
MGRNFLAGQIPAGEDFLVRQIEDLRREVRELQAVRMQPGSVGNDALTSPVRGDVTRAMTTGFGLTTSMATLTSTTWDVPAGFDTVAVFVLAKVFAYNPTAGLDYIQAMARVTVPSIQNIDGGATGTAVSGSNGSGTSIGIGVAVFTGLAANDQVIVKALGQSSFAGWAANSGNYAEISGSLTWYRT